MRDKPPGCYISECPLAVTCSCKHHLSEHPEDGHCTHLDGTVLCECPSFKSSGKGFVLGVGDARASRLGVVLEAPGQEELGFLIDGVGAPGIIPPDELARREHLFPDLEHKFRVKGAPVVGKSGSLLNQWVFPKAGIQRDKIFVDNTLRCLPPKNKQGKYYPIGDDKAKAELCCRQWDRVQDFKPDVVEVTLHPAGLLREINPLPLFIKDLEKASGFVHQGFKTLVLMGGSAATAWLGYADNVSRWRGHYEKLKDPIGGWYSRVMERLGAKGTKKKRAKKSKAATINTAVAGDVLDCPATELPKIRRKRKS